MAPLLPYRRPPTPSGSRTPPTSTPSRTPPAMPPARTSLPPPGITGTNHASLETIFYRRHPYTEATLEIEDEQGFSTPYTPSGTGELWTIYVHCKNGLPHQEYVMFKLERPAIKLSILTTIKDQLGYGIRDFLYYKKRCGRDVATLQPIQYIKHAESMIQDNEMEKEIRLVLSQQHEITQQVSITPVKRQRQQPEKDEHPFTDDVFDAYKVWLKKLSPERSKDLKDDYRDHTVDTYREFLRMKGDIAEIMAFVEQRDTDGIVLKDDESNGSSMTPHSNRPSHARKARVQDAGIIGI